MNRNSRIVTVLLTVALLALPAVGQVYDLFWYTIDGGGVQNGTGGSFNLSASVGQFDAGPAPAGMSGGVFSLVGGFWPAAAAGCTCLGDMNGDGKKNGRDIGLFAQCVITGGACACANVDGLPGLTPNDVAVFVAALLAGDACP